MKGARAKKAAEAAAAAAATLQQPEVAGEASPQPGTRGEAGFTPTAPKEPRAGPPRPGPVVQNSSAYVTIPEEAFNSICARLRKNDLLGPAAADALEEAAGVRGPASPPCRAATELRSTVAEAREDAAEEERRGIEQEQKVRPKKKMGGFAEAVDEIPELQANLEGKPEVEDAPGNAEKEKGTVEPPELNLTPKQNHMRTDLEMWVMEEIPGLFSVDESDELDESLQEDGQALKISQLIAQENPEEQKAVLEEWLRKAPSDHTKAEFIKQIMDKVQKIQALGSKRKKKRADA